MQAYNDVIQRPNGAVVTSGATVTVYAAGTTTLSTIYSDNLSTALANPFTVASTEGEFTFYAANGRYDVVTAYETATDTKEVMLFDSVEDPVLLDGGSDLEIGDPGSEVGGVNVNGATYDAKLRINDIGGTKPAQIVAHRHSTTLPAVLLGTRSNSSDSTHAAVTNSQELFDIIGGGWTGTHYDLFGSINFQVDASGTISATSSPGSIVIKTTPDGSNTPTTDLQIDSSSTSGNTALLIRDVDKAAISRVKSNINSIVQIVEATPYTTYSSHTGIIPWDDTIPQNTEGDEIITVSITPRSATNRLRIIATANNIYMAGNRVTAALFQDAVANGLAVDGFSGTGNGQSIYICHEMVSGTTSPTTFKLRTGLAAADTYYINGTSTARRFGGISAVRLRVEEISVSGNQQFLYI